MYEALLFDFDGVLFDSEPAVWRATNQVLSDFGVSTIPLEAFRHRASNHWKWYQERGVPLSHEGLRALFHRYFDTSDCGLVDGAREMLEDLRHRDIPCSIVSAHHREGIEQKLKEFGVAHFFLEVRAGAEHKTDALRDACRSLQAVPTRTLFVGDLLSDVIDGRAAGVRTALLAPEDSPHARLADHHILSLSDISALF